ncbi:MAG: conjugal transfer protein TrbE, partial [Pseudomonadota bacterium]
MRASCRSASKNSDYPVSDFPDPVSWLIDQERRIGFEEEQSHFESRYYLTVLWLPPADATGSAERALMERPEPEDGADWRDRLTTFQLQTDRAIDLLSSAFAEIEPLDDAATLTYLHDCVSTRRHKVAVPELPVFLDAVLTDSPFGGGLEPTLGDAHLRSLTILGFPAVT